MFSYFFSSIRWPFSFRYAVNITILFYQLGMCSVAILFIADNMYHLLEGYISGGTKTTALITIGISFFISQYH